MEVKLMELKWTDDAMDQIMSNQISDDLACEVHVETEPKPEKGEKVKATLYYGNRKRPVGTDMVTSGGHAFFRGITKKACGEYPVKKNFRVKFETIAKPEEPTTEDPKPVAKPTEDTAKDNEALKTAKLERERREREERKRARREGRDKGENNPQKKDTPPPVLTAASSTPREKFLRLVGRAPNGERGTQIAVLLYSRVEGVDVPEPGDGIIFNDPRDRMEGAVTNRFGVADVTVPYVGERMIYVKHASGSAALHVSVS